MRRYHPRQSLLRMGQESALFQLVGRVCSGIAGLVSNPGSVTFSVSPKAQAKTASELSKSMETMRGHLQAQLRCKEAENSRLCMQIKVPAWPHRWERERAGPGSPGTVAWPRRSHSGFAPGGLGGAAAKAL